MFNRDNYISTVGNEQQAVEFEDRALSIGDEYLSIEARAVRDGGDPTEAYWQWLANEWERAS